MATRARDRLNADEKHLNPKLLSLEPLTPVIGAEIGGVDLSKPISAALRKEINDALLAYHVIYFRDQRLSREDHKRFGRLFGPLHVHPYHAAKTGPAHATGARDSRGPSGVGEMGDVRPDPEILVVKADQASRHVAGEAWHTDVTCDAAPPMGSMLYITQTPAIGGGDTCFASTTRAFEALSPTMQGFLQGLTATHDGAKPYTGGYGAAPPAGGWPRNTHPVVIRHPETGRRALFVNRGFTTRINEVSKSESDALLEMLWSHVEDHPEFQCRVRWTPNMLAFWDNRVTQHHAVWDYYPHSRYGERVSIVGDPPQA
jgi:taurine dioxygenase